VISLFSCVYFFCTASISVRLK